MTSNRPRMPVCCRSTRRHSPEKKSQRRKGHSPRLHRSEATIGRITMNIRPKSTLAACVLGAVLSVLTLAQTQAATFDLSTASIADIQAAMDQGALTSEKLVQLYLARIAAYDQQGPKLNAVLTLNKNALAEARALDIERKDKGPRSPLHGIVVLAKDVYDTHDMPTTGGFKPMATSQPSRDAFVIARLR